jgi:hypothetical protein
MYRCQIAQHSNHTEIHHTPTIEEISAELNGIKIISKLDLRSSYNQLELYPDRRDITLFSTHGIISV